MTSTSDLSSTRPEQAVEEAYRAEWGRLLSLLVSKTRRLDLAEDGLSEAFVRAADRWPHDGVPSNPPGWLFTVAHRQVIGRLRAEAIAGRKAPLLATTERWHPVGGLDDSLGDEQLQLILLCCHPALNSESRSALALRLAIGTPTRQIARLFLVSPATMAARLTRAKRKIAFAGIPLDSPVAEELESRIDEVCRTIYLAFTAGYTPGTGKDLLRPDLAGEAVRLAEVLHHLAPQAAQATAMLALLSLQHSRRDARQQDGHLVTLSDQDRSLWHHSEIRSGLELVSSLSPTDGYAEELRLQALIASEHARAATPNATDWAAIANHYTALEAQTGSAIVRLNRAVAEAEVHGPEVGLMLLESLDEVISDNHRLHSVRGDLAQRAGDISLARTSLQRAIDLATNTVERDHLTARLAAIT